VLASPGIGCGNLWCCLSPRCVSRAKSALPTTPTNARGPSQGPGLKRRPRSNKTPYQPRPARPPDSPVRQQRSARDTHKSTSSVARRTWRPGSDIYTAPACVLATLHSIPENLTWTTRSCADANHGAVIFHELSAGSPCWLCAEYHAVSTVLD
jgi:hypothetical protein